MMSVSYIIMSGKIKYIPGNVSVFIPHKCLFVEGGDF